MDMSIPESHPGKVRQVLFYPNSTNILIAGHKEILLWDTSRQVILSRNEVPSVILGMDFFLLSGLVYLVVLGGDGWHYHFYLRTAEIQRKEEFDALVHPTSGTLEVGSISCYDSTIASSTGSGIMIRTGGANGIPMVKINDRDIFSNHSLHKTISHVKLASSSSLFIFSQKKIVIGYSLLSKACEKALKLTVTPRYVAQSRNAGLFLIHDPWLSGGHFLDATSLSLADIEGITAQALSPGRRPWPVYSAFSEDGSYAVVTERNFIRLHRLRPDRQVENLELACKRLYAVAISIISSDTLRVVAASCQNKETWSISVWDRKILSNRAPVPKTKSAADVRPAPSAKRRKLVTSAEVGPSSSANTSQSSGIPTELPTASLQIACCEIAAGQRSCISCWEASMLSSLSHAEGECRFIHFRVLRPPVASEQEIFRNSPPVDVGQRWYDRFKYPPFEPIRTEQDYHLIKTVAAETLRPLLEQELRHLERPNSHQRVFQIDATSSCDVCHTNLFFETWFCGYCGFEVCHPCYSDLPADSPHDLNLEPCLKAHAQNWFFPVSYFSKIELEENLGLMRSIVGDSGVCFSQILSGGLANAATVHDAPPSPDATILPCYDIASMGSDTFMDEWRKGTPFAVRAVTTSNSPFEILGLTSSSQHPCNIEFHDGYVWRSIAGTLEDYFRSWNTPHSWVQHIRAYPVNSNLRTAHPAVAAEFDSCLQRLSNSMISYQSPVNLCSYLPEKSLMPDFGPKLHIAEKSSSSSGSILLHLDKTGAANMMVLSTWKDDAYEGARWDIWPASSIFYLSKALNPETTDEDCSLGVPITSGTHYVGKEGIEKVVSLGGAVPWTYIQKPGEMILIPPGCPYQVSNLGCCIMVAGNFILPHDVERLKALRPSFRRQNTLKGDLEHTDLARLDALLWYAWRSVL